MPLKGSYTWFEKKDILKITIPVKGISHKDIDIQVTRTLLKVNYSPYLVEILLHDTIDPNKHKAKIVDNHLLITLYKETLLFWYNLEKSDIKVNTQLRQEIQNQQLQYETNLSETRKSKQNEQEKYALRQQMTIDENERQQLETLKLEEKQRAEYAVYETLSKLSQQTNTSSSQLQSIHSTISSSSSSSSASATLSIHDTRSKNDINNILHDDMNNRDFHIDGGSNSHNIIESTAIDNTTKKILPAPRNTIITSTTATSTTSMLPTQTQTQTQMVDIQFTSRIFPTPLRESQVKKEEEWLYKNRKYLKKHAVFGKHLSSEDVTEEDPYWLKARGDDYYRSHDYLSAINAYTHTIELLSDILHSYRYHQGKATTTTSSSSSSSSNSSSSSSSSSNISHGTSTPTTNTATTTDLKSTTSSTIDYNKDDVISTDYDPSLLFSCYANRSMCYYQKKMFLEVIQDGQSCIDLFEYLYIGNLTSSLFSMKSTLSDTSSSIGKMQSIDVQVNHQNNGINKLDDTDNPRKYTGKYNDIHLKLYMTMHMRQALSYIALGYYEYALLNYTKLIICIEIMTGIKSDTHNSSSTFTKLTTSMAVSIDDSTSTYYDDDTMMTSYKSYIDQLHLFHLSIESKNTLLSSMNITSICHDRDIIYKFLQAQDYIDKADKCIQRNTDFTTALSYYSKCLNINPYHILALANRSIIYIYTKQYIDALMDCHLALYVLCKDTLTYTHDHMKIPSNYTIKTPAQLRTLLESIIRTCESHLTDPPNTLKSPPKYPLSTIDWSLKYSYRQLLEKNSINSTTNTTNVITITDNTMTDKYDIKQLNGQKEVYNGQLSTCTCGSAESVLHTKTEHTYIDFYPRTLWTEINKLLTPHSTDIQNMININYMEIRYKWINILLCRRGKIYIQINDYNAALRDYQNALSLLSPSSFMKSDGSSSPTLTTTTTTSILTNELIEQGQYINRYKTLQSDIHILQSYINTSTTSNMTPNRNDNNNDNNNNNKSDK